MSTNQSHSLKFRFQGATRRILIDDFTKFSFTDLVKLLKTEDSHDVSVFFRDDEDELITISSDDELLEAFRLSKEAGRSSLLLQILSNSDLDSAAGIEVAAAFSDGENSVDSFVHVDENAENKDVTEKNGGNEDADLLELFEPPVSTTTTTTDGALDAAEEAFEASPPASVATESHDNATMLDDAAIETEEEETKDDAEMNSMYVDAEAAEAAAIGAAADAAEAAEEAEKEAAVAQATPPPINIATLLSTVAPVLLGAVSNGGAGPLGDVLKTLRELTPPEDHEATATTEEKESKNKKNEGEKKNEAKNGSNDDEEKRINGEEISEDGPAVCLRLLADKEVVTALQQALGSSEFRDAVTSFASELLRTRQHGIDQASWLPVMRALAHQLPQLLPVLMQLVFTAPQIVEGVPYVACAIAKAQCSASSSSNNSNSASPPTGPMHNNIECDGCHAIPIIGVRYKSAVVENFDICEACEKTGKYASSHAPFLKIDHPSMAPAGLVCVLKPEGQQGGSWRARHGKFRGCGGGHRHHNVGRRWRRAMHSQLEEALKPPQDGNNGMLKCSVGHPLASCRKLHHLCDMCNKRGTVLRCTQGCDYDVCANCRDANNAQVSDHDLAVAIDRSLDTTNLVLKKKTMTLIPSAEAKKPGEMIYSELVDVNAPLEKHPRIDTKRGFLLCDGTNGWVEYKMTMPAKGINAFKVRVQLNAKQSRPLALKVNGRVLDSSFAHSTTGEWWDRSKMRWFEHGPYLLPTRELSNLDSSGQEKRAFRVRLETRGFFPHIGGLSFAAVSKEELDRSAAQQQQQRAVPPPPPPLLTTPAAASDQPPPQYQQQQQKTKKTISQSSSMAVTTTHPAQAKFVADVSVQDGEHVTPNSVVTKTWRVKNTGIQAWPKGCRVINVGGDLLNGPANGVELDPLESGSEGNVSVTLKAPSAPGRYVGYWRLVGPDGRRFGHRFWIDIRVDHPKASAPTPSPPSPPPAAPSALHSKKKKEMLLVKHAAKLARLADMGFLDTDAALAALELAKGDLGQAVVVLLSKE